MKFTIKKEELAKIPAVNVDHIVYLNMICGNGTLQASIFGKNFPEKEIEVNADVKEEGFGIIVANNFNNVVNVFVDGSDIECEFKDGHFTMNAKNISISIKGYEKIPESFLQ